MLRMWIAVPAQDLIIQLESMPQSSEQPVMSLDLRHRMAAHTEVAWTQPVSTQIAVLSAGEPRLHDKKACCTQQKESRLICKCLLMLLCVCFRGHSQLSKTGVKTGVMMVKTRNRWTQRG